MKKCQPYELGAFKGCCYQTNGKGLYRFTSNPDFSKCEALKCGWWKNEEYIEALKQRRISERRKITFKVVELYGLHR